MRPTLACCLTALTIACSGFDGLTDLDVCNSIGSAVTVVVIDDSGTPLDSLAYRTTHVQTRQRIPLDTAKASHWRAYGEYPVITEDHIDLLSQRGDELRFVAWDENWVATASFVAAAGLCEVVKRSGPDTIVAF